jgi:peptide/nickel transport system substrate-binding protein
MRKRLLGLLGSTMIVLAACQGAASPSPSASTAASQPAASEPADSGSAAPSGSAGASGEPSGSGDTGGEPDLFSTTYTDEVGEGTDGGQIILGDWQEATQFNPYYFTQVTEANVSSATWSGLVVQTHDFKYMPDLAEEIPTTENGGVEVPGQDGDAMTVTWNLKPDLAYSDGEPLTCDDYAYTWEWILDEGNTGLAAGTAGWENITEVECASDTEMILHFDEIYEGYILLMTAPLPRHYFEAIPIADQLAGAGFRAEEIANLPVSGPFAFESVTPGQELRLVRNENFKGGARNAPAYLENVIFKWYGDADAMIAGYRGGEVDAATDLQDSDLPKVEDLGDQVSAVPSLTYEFLRPNWATGEEVGEDGVGDCSRNPAVQDRGEGCPMADPAMREAVAFAIDKNAINERLLANTVEIANTSVSPGAWFYADQPPATYDPAQAQQILEDAGWVDSDGDGIREKDGLKAKIELCTTTRQTRIDTLALIAGWLKEVGIDSVINAVDASAIFADYNEATLETACALSRSNFDLAEHAFSSPLDPLSAYFSYHSSQFRPDSSNDAQVNNEDIDAALDTVRTSVDFSESRSAMADFQRVYVEETVEIPLYYRKNVELVSPKLGNFFANPTTSGPTWNAWDWYVAEG